MHPTEVFGFSAHKYKEKITNQDSYSLQDIAANVYKKRRAINASKASAVGGVAAAHFTGGTSLVTSVYSVRNIAVEKHKLELLEEELFNRCQSTLAKRPMQDMVIPIAIEAALGLLTCSVNLGLSELAQGAICPLGVPVECLCDAELVSEGCSGVKHGAEAVAEAKKKKKADERNHHHHERNHHHHDKK